MNRSNYSDNIETGSKCLYLQTHSQDDPPEAVSVLFLKGRVLGKSKKSIARTRNGQSHEKATELYHMANIEAIQKLVNYSLKPFKMQETAKIIKIIHSLIKWGLLEEALSITEKGILKFKEDKDLLQLQGEILTYLARYNDAVYILSKLYEIQPDNSRAILLIILCLLHVLSRVINENKQNLLLLRIKNCLDRLKEIRPDLLNFATHILAITDKQEYIKAITEVNDVLSIKSTS